MSVRITVNYEKKNFAVTVINGKASVNGVVQITAHYGDTVTLTAITPFGQSVNEYNYSWQCESGGVVIANSTARVATFQMPASPVVIVCTVTRKTYAITTTNCSTNLATAAAGSRIEITDAPETGYHLETLTVTGNTSGNAVSTTAASNQPYVATFTMPNEPVTVVATYAKTVYNIATTDCTARVNGQTATTATYGDTVTLTARTLATGEQITNWTGHDSNNNAITFASGTQTSTTTSFTMPAGDVSVQPLFDDINYVITANNCSVSNPAGGTANYGQTVTMQATIPAGQSANEYDITWSSVPSVTINKSTTVPEQSTFVMPASDIAVTASVVRKTYSITANYATAKISGTTVSSAAKDQVVTITAQDRASSGLRFVRWNVSNNITNLGNATAQTTTFTMPSGAVTVTAVYEYIINTTRCTAKISGNTVTNAPSGASVTFTADAPTNGTIFKRLEVTYNGNTTNVTQTTYTLTMPAYEVTVVAVYSGVYGITAATAPTGGTATIYDSNMTNVISYAEAGDTVHVVPQAPANGMTFSGWTVVSNNISSSSTANDGTLTFTMPSSAVELQANYKYNISTTVSGTAAQGSSASASVACADAGDTINLSATVPTGQSASEYTFLWTCTAGGVTTITGNTSQNATFTMPASAVTFNCQITRKTYQVTVNNGTGSVGGTNKGSSFSVQSGTVVNLTPSTIQSYQHFTRWTVNSGGITVTVDNNTTGAAHFTMPSGAVTVTAVIDNTEYNVNVTDGKAYSNSGHTTEITKGVYNQTVYLGFNTIADTVFHNWVEANNLVTFANANQASTSFTMVGSHVNISAVYGYVITKHGVTIGGVEQSIPAVKVNGTAVTDAIPGTTVELTAAEPPTGYDFAGWTVTGDGQHTVTLSPNTTSNVVRFTMPACAVDVVANYTEQTPVTAPYHLTRSDDASQSGAFSLCMFYKDAACTQPCDFAPNSDTDQIANAGDTVYFRPIITRDWYDAYKFTLQVESGTAPNWADQTADPADSGPIAWRNWQMPNDSTATSRPHVGYGNPNDIDVWAFTMPACDVNVECSMNWWCLNKKTTTGYNNGWNYTKLNGSGNLHLQEAFRVDVDTSQYNWGSFEVSAYTVDGVRSNTRYASWQYDNMQDEGTDPDEVLGDFDLREQDTWSVASGRNHWFLVIDMYEAEEAEEEEEMN